MIPNIYIDPVSIIIIILLVYSNSVFFFTYAGWFQQRTFFSLGAAAST